MEDFYVKINCGNDLAFKERIGDIVAAALRSHGYKIAQFLTPDNDTETTIGE